jgi:hypothetical protein
MRTVLCLLSSSTALVDLSHAGMRSRQMLGYLLATDFESIFSHYRGSDAWSQEIAPQVPRY